ncbi:MAG: glycerophosphodiester phosphodiesterase [Bacteroidota bacterium]|nr:glycerophosphodiester phosphodiesterase [Bacteroidota bacterium]
MIFRNLFYLLFPALFTACQKELAVPPPEVRWDLFDSPDAVPLPAAPREPMEGVYSVMEGTGIFGEQVALKWSYLISAHDTTHHVSIFGEKNIVYLTGEAKRSNGSILMNMYWRTLNNTDTGPCWMQISPENGADQLQSENPEITEGNILIEGNYGATGADPITRIALRYVRPLNQDTAFSILAHRGGGRNSDQLPASENSLELIRLAPRLGATGIEIDVKLTSDGVPILYHDDDLNIRLVQDVGLYGPINEYSFAQLDGMVRLVNGERIPTLRGALQLVVEETDLNYVWLDVKYEGSLAAVREIQQEFLDLASATGRDLHILIGLPGEEQIDQFKQLTNYQEIPSLNELELNDVRETNSDIWAPTWVSGQQDEDVLIMKSEGRKVFVWTMDVPNFIEQYMYQGHFDGILSNYPSLVAYYHYVRQ